MASIKASRNAQYITLHPRAIGPWSVIVEVLDRLPVDQIKHRDQRVSIAPHVVVEELLAVAAGSVALSDPAALALDLYPLVAVGTLIASVASSAAYLLSASLLVSRSAQRQVTCSEPACCGVGSCLGCCSGLPQRDC